jgi:hypothetical protein
VKPKLFVFAPDVHYPKIDKKTLRALLHFMRDNPVDGFIFGGDQFDNECISHHTKGKPLLRNARGFLNDEIGFEKSVLSPIEKLLPKNCQRIWIIGNHDRWEHELVEEQPELDGALDRPSRLRLKDRGWKVIPCGKEYTYGKLTFIHGETLSSSQHAKKAVETYCCNLVYAHFHSPQSYTKTLPLSSSQKWMAYCSPILGRVDPYYLRNRPTGWLNGFTLVEFRPNGDFNVFPVVCARGKFSYGGKIYG